MPEIKSDEIKKKMHTLQNQLNRFAVDQKPANNQAGTRKHLPFDIHRCTECASILALQNRLLKAVYGGFTFILISCASTMMNKGQMRPCVLPA